MKQAVFLDRDGVICREGGYIGEPRQFQLIPGAGEAIRIFNKRGLKAIVVTNQSGVARGYFAEGMVAEMNRTMSERLGEEGGYLDGIYYCPHHPQGVEGPYRKVCDCRKPATGLLKRAACDHGIDLSSSYLIGDKRSDMECASRAGARGILVLTGYGAEEYKSMTAAPGVNPAFIAADLLEAARWVINHISSEGYEDIDNKVERDR